MKPAKFFLISLLCAGSLSASADPKPVEAKENSQMERCKSYSNAIPVQLDNGVYTGEFAIPFYDEKGAIKFAEIVTRAEIRGAEICRGQNDLAFLEDQYQPKGWPLS